MVAQSSAYFSIFRGHARQRGRGFGALAQTFGRTAIPFIEKYLVPAAKNAKKKNLKFIQGVDFDLIENLPNNRTKYLLMFEVSCEEISNFKQFVKIATAGRHRGLNTIYIKHNLFHQSKLVRDVELHNAHIVLLKSPRDVLQINALSQQLGLGSQLKEWYQDATSVPYGHLIVDLINIYRTVHELSTLHKSTI